MGRYHPYPCSRTNRGFAFYSDEISTKTVHPPYNGPRLDHLLQPVTVHVEPEVDETDVVNLEEVVSAPRDEAIIRTRRLSLSTLVVDLALVFRQGLERLRALKDKDDIIS